MSSRRGFQHPARGSAVPGATDPSQAPFPWQELPGPSCALSHPPELLSAAMGWADVKQSRNIQILGVLMPCGAESRM